MGLGQREAAPNGSASLSLVAEPEEVLVQVELQILTAEPDVVAEAVLA